VARGFIPVGLRSRPRLWHHAYSNRTNQPDGAAAQPSGDKSPHHKNKGTFSRLENRSKRTSTCHTGRLRLIRHRSLCSWLCGPLLWRGSLLPLECEALIAFLGPLRDPAGASSLATRAKAISSRLENRSKGTSTCHTGRLHHGLSRTARRRRAKTRHF